MNSVQEIGGVIPDRALADLTRALGVEVNVSGSTNGDSDMNGGAKSKLAVSKTSGQGFKPVQTQVEKIIREGYSSVQILSQVSHLSPRFKSRIPC